MKRCTGCDGLKHLEEFGRDRSKPDGRHTRCRVCKQRVNRESTRKWRAKNPDYLRRYYEEHREEVLAQQKADYAANPEKYSQRAREQYLRHGDSYRERARRWREAHPGRYSEYLREWAEQNREKVREYSRRSGNRRRARLAGLPSEDIDLKVVFERDQGMCGICGGQVDPDDWHLDHVVPIALGGPHLYGNVQVTHPTCNLSKGAKHEALLDGDIGRTGDPQHG